MITWLRSRIHEDSTVRPLIKFGLVGGTGYVINLSVFAVTNGVMGLHPIPAAVLAFSVAVLNNFVWNRIWTFRSTDSEVGLQALKFLTVSLAGLSLNLVILTLLHELTPLTELWAQAIAVALVMPVNFLLNRAWTFSRRDEEPCPVEVPAATEISG